MTNLINVCNDLALVAHVSLNLGNLNLANDSSSHIV